MSAKSDREIHMDRYPDDFVDDSEEYADEDDWEYFDCHMDRRGFCGKAGSEECDFECPYRNVKRN